MDLPTLNDQLSGQLPVLLAFLEPCLRVRVVVVQRNHAAGWDPELTDIDFCIDHGA